MTLLDLLNYRDFSFVEKKLDGNIYRETTLGPCSSGLCDGDDQSVGRWNVVDGVA